MTPNNVRNIIRRYFGKHFSELTRTRFLLWLGMPTDQIEKDSVLEEIWNESPNTITIQTLRDYKKLQDEIQKKKSIERRFNLHRYIQYAAIVMLIVITGITVYNLPSRKETIIKNTEYQEAYVPNGQNKDIILADGSKVSISAGSILIYPKTFDGDARMIYLNGQARFEVTKDSVKPFIVSTPQVNVTVLGTIFTVEAYPENSKTTAILEEGSVRFETKGENPHYDIMKPLEKLTYYHDTQKLTKNTVSSHYITTMRKGVMIFEDASFDEIMSLMEKRYDVIINYDRSKYKDHSYNIKILPDENIEEALLIMGRLIDNFTYTRVNKTISIK